ncbi:MAG: lysophospholipid acyltransferase family protein [Gammaproteobacteria bacterium]|nr:lysophospholipid acyltransferase family protein [Gammaproteobacteria bacterium]
MNKKENKIWLSGLYLRALIYWLGVAVVSVLHNSTLFMTRRVLPPKAHYAWATLWNRFNIFWLELICGVTCRVEGLENIPDQPCIAFAKHQSTWETIKLPILLPRQVWVVKKELLKIPFFGWALDSLEPIAIDRSAGRRAIVQMIRQGRERLDSGRWIVVFPEGTRVLPGEKVRYKMGGAVLAEKMGVPVIPVAHNAGEFWPKHSFIKWPGEITVSIGAPISTEGKTANEINAEAEAWIETKMLEISGLTSVENN